MMFRHRTHAPPTTSARIGRTLGLAGLLALAGTIAGPACAQVGAQTGGAQPSAAGPSAAGTAAELAFWNSVKDSGSIGELEAYLKRYPQGTFAELAQLRLEKLKSTQLGKLATSLGQAAVREAQLKLYELNYAIKRFDGVTDAETTAAIKRWQERAKVPATGKLTLEQLARLRKVPSVPVWSAIAYVPSRGYASIVHGQNTRALAEQKVLAACRKKAGNACEVRGVPAGRCLAIATYRAKLPDGRISLTTGAAYDKALANAEKLAKDNCGRTASTTACKVMASTCATVPGTGQPGAGGSASPKVTPLPNTKPPAKKDGQDA